MKELYWIDTKWGCGGVWVADGKIYAGAPIFRTLKGQTIDKIKKVYKVVHILTRHR